MNEVNYKALGDAVQRLREALARLRAHPVGDDLHVATRDSVLLSFQFTYGLCRPMIERFPVSLGEDPQTIEAMSLATLIRSANERGVLRGDWTVWSGLRDARNRIAHSYSEPVAEEIAAKAPLFLNEAEYLYAQLLARSSEV